jgi:hypothetical protein
MKILRNYTPPPISLRVEGIIKLFLKKSLGRGVGGGEVTVILL